MERSVHPPRSLEPKPAGEDLGALVSGIPEGEPRRAPAP